MRPFLALAVLLGTCATLPACGGGTESTEAAPTSSTASATTAARPEPAVSAAADRRTTRHAALELSNLPTGWTEPDPDGGAKRASAATCDGASPHGPSVSSRTDVEFRNAPDGRVTQTVTMFKTEAAAAAMISDLSSAKTRKCLAEYFDDRADRQGAEGIEYDDATSAKLNVAPLGDGTAAFRISISASSGTYDRTFFTDAIATRIGRGVSLLQFSEVSPEEETDLTAAAHRRLSSSLAKQ